MKVRIFLCAATILLTTALSGSVMARASDDKPVAVATTTMISDLVRQVGADRIEVHGILSPGADPHTYKPVPGDAIAIAQSDIVFRNGLYLEGWMNKLVENAGGERPVITVSEGVEALADPAKSGHPDPHIWFSVPFWKIATDNVAKALAEFDPVGAEVYLANAERYKMSLDSLHAWARTEMEKIPEKHRYLVTSHDAFNYFGHEYNMTVIGVQGISTESQASSQDVAAIIKFIKAKNVPAIFVETSVNPKLIEEISRQSNARIGGTLYGDSTGPAGSGAETYIGMLSANVRTIVKALGGK